MSEQRIETGTSNENICVQEFKVLGPDRWLISYGADPDAGLLWHEIRFLTDEAREVLAKKLTDAGIKWDMLNLTSAERGEPWTIEQYIESQKEQEP